MPADQASATQSQEKFSRYRSVRNPPNPAPIPSTFVEKIDLKSPNVQRSLSRYRKTSSGRGNSSAPSVPQPLQGANVQRMEDALQNGVSRIAKSPKAEGIGRQSGASHALDNGTSGNKQDKPVYSSSKTVAKAIPLGKQQGEEGGFDPAEIAEMLAEQKRKDLERLDRELAAAVRKQITSPKPNLVTSKIGTLFSRKHESVNEELKTAPKPSIDMVSKLKTKESQEAPHARAAALTHVDAPVSAVNAGERRVLVRCKQSSISLPVTPETTTSDLIYTAANVLSQAVTPSEAILVESYGKLGLDRRIRRYEHIRDVLNSWDRDSQNELILTASCSPTSELDLEVSSVPKKRPDDLTLQMYHSQHIGNWNKRYVTLLSSGQIFTSKKPGAKLTDKDVTPICHLTDFDIYSIATRQAKKNLQPPKKHCCAIKSQQKPSMFLNTENFVHFFAVEDVEISDKWYTAVQTWRSWYLIYIRGEGSKSDTPSAAGKSGMASENKGVRRSSSDEMEPYIIGSLKPLLDLETFGKSFDDKDEKPRARIPSDLRSAPVLAPSLQEKHRRNRPQASLTRQSRPGTARDSSDVDRPPKSRPDLDNFRQTFDDEDDNRPLQIPQHLRQAPIIVPPLQEEHQRSRPPVSRSGQTRPVTARDSSDLDRSPKPRRDMDSFRRSFDDEDENRLLQIPPRLRQVSAIAPPLQEEHRRSRPPISRSGQTRPSTARDSSDLDRSNDAATFSNKGLLGRTYTLRQQAQENRYAAAESEPFAQGSSPLNRPSTAASRPASSSGSVYRSSRDTRRTMSMRNTPSSQGESRVPPMPLIDLTPKFVEARQWNMYGKGHGVAAPTGVPLVEAAKSRNLGAELSPPSALLRRTS